MLRPSGLIAAREDAAASRISRARFKAIEDLAVEDAIRLQERVRLPVITDGEQRRLSFQSRFAESVSGLGDWNLNTFLWGHWRRDSSTVDDRTIERPAGLGVVEKLQRSRYLSVEDFVFLRARTTRTPKIALPSPRLWANFWSAQSSRAAYSTLESFLADVVDKVGGARADHHQASSARADRRARKPYPRSEPLHAPRAFGDKPAMRLFQLGIGNAITAADQERKLRLVVETAQRVWGEATRTATN